jgi:hypothetical protein
MTRIDTLYREAASKLDAYLATGITGFLQQAKDRLRELGIKCGDCSAAHLREHLRLMGV